MVVVLGIGNTLLGDDGVGIAVVRRLEDAGLPPSVRLVDGGTGGLGLLHILADARAAVVIDAVDAKLAPGSVVKLDGDRLGTGRAPVSLHHPRLADLLALLRRLGRRPRLRLVGVQVADVSPGELSGPVRDSLPAVVRAVRREVDALIASGAANA